MILKRKLACISCLLYSFIVLWYTILSRDSTSCHNCCLTPLTSWRNALFTNFEAQGMYALKEIMLNVIMFIPIGFLIRWCSLYDKWYFAVIYSCVFSIAIEVTQLLTRRGLCEIDDVIHNTIGAMIGVGLFCFTRIFWRYRH